MGPVYSRKLTLLDCKMAPTVIIVLYLILCIISTQCELLEQRRKGYKLPLASEGNLDYRLTGNTVPKTYHIDLVLNNKFWDNPTFKGNVEIKIQVEKDTKELILHAVSLTIDPELVKIYDEIGEPVPMDHKIATNATTETITITLKTPVKEGRALRVVIKNYSGKLHDDNYGFYKSFSEKKGNKT